MGQKKTGKTDDAIRRDWLRKVKEMWEKRKRGNASKSDVGAERATLPPMPISAASCTL